MPVMPTPTNHAPVTVALVASSVTALLIAFAKNYGVDLAGQEAHIQVLATAAGYLISRSSQ